MQHFVSFVVGILFGGGLLLSGMTDPAKVLGFLDLFGVWDPSLALVMGGAIVVAVFAFLVAQKRQQQGQKTLLGNPIYLPTATQVDKPLVIGALLFGAGWGMAGFCPGPAIVSMATGHTKAIVFVIFMVLGMAIFEGLQRKHRP